MTTLNNFNSNLPAKMESNNNMRPLKSSLKNVIKINKEDVNLTLNEVKTCIKEMNILLEDTEIVDTFNHIDKDQIGKIKKTELIEHFRCKNKRASIKIADYFNSNADKAITKLKKLKNKFEKYKDYEAIKDIDWIMTAILSNALGEPEIRKFEDEDPDEQDVLKQYSHAQESIFKRNDINKIASACKSTKNLNYSVIGIKNRDNISEVSGITNTINTGEENKLYNRRNTHLAR